VSRKIAFGDREGRLYMELDRCVESYWQLRKLQEEYPTLFLWQRYRDVVSNLPAAVGETADFFELAPSEEALQAVAAECSMDSAKTRVDTLKAQLSTVLNEMRKRDPRKAGEILRLVGRGADLGVIGFNDDESLIGYNQVSHYQGEVGVWRKRLDARTREEIERRYGDWYDDAFGADWADSPTADAPVKDAT
jgi:hypothetical protein